MLHYYTFGRNGRRGVILSDRQAQIYNRFTRSFLKAQENFEKEHGRPWTQEDPFELPMGTIPLSRYLRSREELDEYHALIKVLHRQYAFRRFILFRPIHNWNMTGDYLVRKPVI